MREIIGTTLLLAATAILTLSAVNAYDNDALGAKGQFVIRGKIESNNDGVLHAAISDFTKHKSFDIPLDSLGNFQETVSITGPLQTMYVYLNDAFTIPVVPNDTVTLIFSEGKVQLSGIIPAHDNDLKMAVAAFENMRPRAVEIMESPMNLPDDSSRIATANLYNSFTHDYNALINEIERDYGKLAHPGYFQADAYYTIIDRADHRGITDLITERPDSAALNIIYPSYREHLLNAMKMSAYGEMNARNVPEDSTLIFILESCRDGAPDSFTKDLITAQNIRDFGMRYPFDEISFVKDAAAGISTDWLREESEDYIKSISRISKGNPMPELTLVNEKGDTLTLADFKGTSLMLDIWGVGCGFCMMEFEKMKEFDEIFGKYSDNFKVLTICTHPHPFDDEAWRNVVRHYDLSSINTLLVADKSDPVYKSYPMPTYFIIDREGKIYQAHSDRPSDLIRQHGDGVTTLIDQVVAE